MLKKMIFTIEKLKFAILYTLLIDINSGNQLELKHKFYNLYLS